MIAGWLTVLSLPVIVAIIGVAGLVAIARERKERRHWASVQRMLCEWCAGPVDLGSPVPRCTCFRDCGQPGCRQQDSAERGLG